MKAKEELSKEIVEKCSEIQKIYFENERSLLSLDSRLNCFDNVSWIDYELYCCDRLKDKRACNELINDINNYIHICECHGADSRFVYTGAIKSIYINLYFIKKYVNEYISQIKF